MNKDKLNELRPEYNRDDLGQGVRGKYYEDFKSSKNLVLLAPDVASNFADEEEVNEALRFLIKLARKSVRREGE